MALDMPNNPVCLVSHPAPRGELWHGTHGNARIVTGEAFALTSDGTKHPI